jgi:hypothetical protein
MGIFITSSQVFKQAKVGNFDPKHGQYSKTWIA